MKGLEKNSNIKALVFNWFLSASLTLLSEAEDCITWKSPDEWWYTFSLKCRLDGNIGLDFRNVFIGAIPFHISPHGRMYALFFCRPPPIWQFQLNPCYEIDLYISIYICVLWFTANFIVLMFLSFRSDTLFEILSIRPFWLNTFNIMISDSQKLCKGGIVNI